jgi:hypothetical protein
MNIDWFKLVVNWIGILFLIILSCAAFESMGWWTVPVAIGVMFFVNVIGFLQLKVEEEFRKQRDQNGGH